VTPHVVVLRRASQEHLRGVHTFYLTSLTGGPQRYVVKVIRRRRRTATCTCPDFVHRAGPLGRACKHVRLLRAVLRRVGGLQAFPRGAAAAVERGGRR
jgi:hypothetical protein